MYLYQQIKQDLRPAGYLTANMPQNRRSLVGRLLNGTLLLAIELGRFENIPRQERMCKVCNIEVESESHFLFRCISLMNVCIKHYHDYPEILNLNSTHEKISFLNSHPYKFSRFVEELWQERGKILTNKCNFDKV